MIKAILWDLDGTLIDSEPVHEAAFHAQIQELGLVLPNGFHEQLLGSSGLQVFEKVMASTELSMTIEQWRALKWEHFQAHAQQIVAITGIQPMLDKLKQHGIPMAVVSNSTKNEVQLGLQQSEFEHYMSAIITRDDVQEGKPSPEGYLLAARQLNVAPQECIVVEDSLLGAVAGLEAGAAVIYHPQIEVDQGGVPAGVHYVQAEKNLAEHVYSLLKLPNLQ